MILWEQSVFASFKMKTGPVIIKVEFLKWRGYYTIKHYLLVSTLNLYVIITIIE
jgi:hypothetical protein